MNTAPKPDIEDLRRERRRAAIAHFEAAQRLLSHVDAEVPAPAGPLLDACNQTLEAVLDADLAMSAEEFQLSLIPILGRRGDQPPRGEQ